MINTNFTGDTIGSAGVRYDAVDQSKDKLAGGVSELLLNPFVRDYKDDPRFIAFAQKIGVMPKAAATP